MDNKQLKKLSRRELLEILIEQSKEIDRLQSLLDEANRKLETREIIIGKAGNIADASLQLNNIFAVAQQAADQYLDSIRAIHQQLELSVQGKICKNTNMEPFPETVELSADTDVDTTAETNLCQGDTENLSAETADN